MPVPYLIVSPASDAIAFYARAFGATEVVRLAMPGGKIAHAELRLGGDTLMLADEHPDEGYVGPQRLGGTPVSLYLSVADVDAVHARALAAGATERMAPADQFDGDRRGTLVDPFGHVWAVATRKEEVSNAELLRRFAKAIAAEGANP
jgi:PhnB protein